MRKSVPGSPDPAPVVQTTVTKTTQIVQPEPADEKQEKPPIESFVASIPPEQLKDYAFYLYRCESSDIDTRDGRKLLARLFPPEKAVDETKGEYSLAEVFAVDPNFWNAIQMWTMQKFGGPHFRLQINSSKLGGGVIYNVSFSNEQAPKLSSREYLKGGAATPGSSTEAWLMERVAKTLDEKITAVNQNKMDPSDALTQAIKTVAEIQNTSLTLMMSKLPQQQNPLEQLQMMKSMFDLFRPPTPAAPPAPAVDFQTQLTAYLTMMDLIDKRRGVPTEPAPGSPDWKKALAEVVTETVNKMGLGGGSRRPSGPSFLESMAEIIKPLTPALAPLVIKLADRIQNPPAPPPGAAMVPRTPGSPPQPINPQPTTQPPNMSGPPRPAASPQTAAAPPSGGVQSISEETENAIKQKLITTQIVDWVQHDVSGEVAAGTLYNMFPREVVLLRMMDVEKLLAYVAADPILRQVKDDPRLPQFCHDFLAWFTAPSEAADPSGESLPN